MNQDSIMKVNGIFKRSEWKPCSKAEYERFLKIEEKLRNTIKDYDLPKDKFPLVQKYA